MSPEVATIWTRTWRPGIASSSFQATSWPIESQCGKGSPGHRFPHDDQVDIGVARRVGEPRRQLDILEADRGPHPLPIDAPRPAQSAHRHDGRVPRAMQPDRGDGLGHHQADRQRGTDEPRAGDDRASPTLPSPSDGEQGQRRDPDQHGRDGHQIGRFDPRQEDQGRPPVRRRADPVVEPVEHRPDGDRGRHRDGRQARDPPRRSTEERSPRW